MLIPHPSRHDRVAAGAAGRKADLYRPCQGEPNATETVAAWISRPDGMSYPELMELLAPAVTQSGGVWGRKLVLGSAPESKEGVSQLTRYAERTLGRLRTLTKLGTQ